MHKIKPTKFCLYVDDFGIKYTLDADGDNLIKALKTSYKFTVDKEELDLCGLHLDWNYDKEYVNIFIPQYI